MDFYIDLKNKFEKNRDEEKADQMSAYMRRLFSFYGIQAQARRTLYKDFLKEEKKTGAIDWDLVDKAFEDDYREVQYFAMDYLKAMETYLSFQDLGKLKTYVKTKQWWDTIDVLSKTIGSIGLADERLDEVMVRWSQDEDFWIRRVAIIHQLSRKEKTKTDLLEKILVNNFGSDEFFINKAIGWSLRDYAKTNPQWVRGFIEEYKDKMDKLSIKEAGKYL